MIPSDENDVMSLNNKIAQRIGYGITQELVREFIRPDGMHGDNTLHFDTDLIDRNRILSVFGIRETTRYPFERFRSNAATAALKSSEEKQSFLMEAPRKSDE